VTFALCFYSALSLVSAGVLWPMLRNPRMRLADAPEIAFLDIPVTAFDSRGFA
jgi:hypothetical protein